MKATLPFFFLLFALNSAKAAVITRDVQHTMGVDSYVFIDVNNDGINDYLLSTGNGSYGPITIKGYNGCKVETGGDGKAIGLNTGAPVGNNSWEDSATIYDFGSGVYYFPLNTFASLGFKLFKNAQTYYGYMHMEISGSGSINSVSTFSVGYETTPAQGITAGAQPNPVIEVGTLKTVEWAFTNTDLQITTSGISNSELSIYSYDGKMVLQRKLNTEVAQIDLQALPAGTYLFAVVNEKARYARAFIKK